LARLNFCDVRSIDHFHVVLTVLQCLSQAAGAVADRGQQLFGLRAGTEFLRRRCGRRGEIVGGRIVARSVAALGFAQGIALIAGGVNRDTGCHEAKPYPPKNGLHHFGSIAPK
jgi:hypothetical protein